MPRINEHTFKLENNNYKLTYYRNENPVVYINDKIYSGNKTELLKKYIMNLGLDFNLKGLTTQQLSSIVLKHFSGQNNSQNKKISPKASSNTTIQNIPIDKQIDEKFEKLDWNKLKNKQTPKLLIIGCSDSKTQGGVNQNEINYFNSPEYANLLNDRNANKIRYNRLLLSDPNYFIIKNNGTNIKRGNIPVTNTYFSNCINGNLFKTAPDRYAGGDFYKPAHILLYRQKNVSANLHILIISGLYGVIEFNDTILDYHLEIDKLKYWKNRTSINDTINKYIVENKIDNNSVFYSLSDKYLEVLKPVSNLWTNLWVKNGRSGSGKTSASVILRFLNQL